jgi:antitoxin component of RelBE/YafQ-DinJ toxin-antitoxin module
MKKDTNIPPVRVSEVIRKKAEQRAEELGMNLSDYIRYLILKDTEGK